MLYDCTHMATVGVKGSTRDQHCQKTFMSAMESTLAWLFERCWNSSISCFMLLPISPKFRYRFWQTDDHNRYQINESSNSTLYKSLQRVTSQYLDRCKTSQPSQPITRLILIKLNTTTTTKNVQKNIKNTTKWALAFVLVSFYTFLFLAMCAWLSWPHSAFSWC